MASVSAEKLLTAHVAFELNRWGDETLSAELAEELGALYDWLVSVPVETLVQRRSAVALLESRLIAVDATEDGRAFLRTLLQKTRIQLHSTHISLGQIVPRELYDRMVEVALGADRLRLELIREFVNSPIFTRIISEILIDGIKKFAQENNPGKNLPGAQVLFALGQNLVSGVVPGLEQKFDANIKQFIAAHSREILRDSEEIVERSMKPELLRQAASDLYEHWSDRTLSDLTMLLPDTTAADAAFLEALWNNLRRPLAENLATLWVDLFLNHYGTRPVAYLLGQGGMTREIFQREGDLVLAPALRAARESGYLETRMRARLGRFYESDAVKKLLGQEGAR